MRFFTEISRAAVQGDTLSGYAVVFDQPSTQPAKWRGQIIPAGGEMIARTAFDGLLVGDVEATVNHDPFRRLGSTGDGNVRLHVDSTGLAFEIDLPPSDLGATVRRMVDRGELTGASFTAGTGQFTRESGRIVHTRFEDFREIAVVRAPAYGGAVVREAAEQTLPGQLVRARFRVLMEGSK